MSCPRGGPPFVNVALIVANVAVWLFYELPNAEAVILRLPFHPCAVDVTDACRTAEPWGITWSPADR